MFKLQASVGGLSLNSEGGGITMKVTVYENRKYLITAWVHTNGTVNGSVMNKITRTDHKWIRYGSNKLVLRGQGILPQYIVDYVESFKPSVERGNNLMDTQRATIRNMETPVKVTPS